MVADGRMVEAWPGPASILPPPSPARHGLMVPLQLWCSASRSLAFLYANDCKLTLSVQPDL